MHDRARCKTDLFPALTTFQNTWPGLKMPRFTELTTGWALETFRPPYTLQMASARRFVREETLKLQKSPRVI